MRAPPFPAAAIHAARLVTLPKTLWQRPQVQGITIDGPESRDLDDALWLEPDSGGGAIASIHITDVAESIPLGSTLDQTALERTATQYYPGFNAPMLPHSLSEAALSLLPGQRRATLTVRMQLDPLAGVKQIDIQETWLASAHQFSYGSADAAIANPAAPFSDMLQRCQYWAEQLYQRRKASGAIGGMAAQPGQWIDENGQLMADQAARYHSHQIIQEFMILANTVVAQWLAEQDTLALYRNHSARAFATETDQTLADWIDQGLPDSLYRQLQHCLNRAEYSPHLVGHFALKLPAYCHFTSPIRRIADLINHRIVKARLHQQPHPYRLAELEAMSTYIAEVLAERDDTTSDFFRQQRSQLYDAQLAAPEQLQSLSDKEFSRLVKYVVKLQAIESLLPELVARLQANRLMPQDLYLILICSDHRTLQDQLLDYLQQQAHICQSIVTIAAAQQDDWQALGFTEQKQSNVFVTWLEVVQAGGLRQTTAIAGLALRKQAARHQACWLWLSAFVKGELIPPDQRTPPTAEALATITAPRQPAHPQPPMTATPTNLNRVSMLNDLCQQQGWSPPIYEFFEQEQGFCCECRLETGVEVQQGTGMGKGKRAAKHEAAGQVLDRAIAVALIDD